MVKVKVKAKANKVGGTRERAHLVPHSIRGEHAGDEGVREHPAPYS